MVEYVDVIYATTIVKNVVYNTNSTSVTGAYLNTYVPAIYTERGPSWSQGAAAPFGGRPAVIWAHGGGFTQGSKDSTGETGAYAMARRGYVAFSIDYRMPQPYQPIYSENVAIADMRAAIRWVKTNAATYGVDTTKIVAAGDSAGGFAAFQSAISNYEEPNGNNGLMGASSRPAAVLALWPPVTQKSWCLPTAVPQSTNIAAGNLDICAIVHGLNDGPPLYPAGVAPEESWALWNYLVAQRGADKPFLTHLSLGGHTAFTRAPFEYPGSPGVPYLNYTKVYQEGFLEDAIGKVCVYLRQKLGLTG